MAGFSENEEFYRISFMQILLFIFFRVIDSKNPKYPVGVYVSGMLGWRSHTICGGTQDNEGLGGGISVRLAPKNMGNLPLSTLLGVAGMTG